MRRLPACVSAVVRKSQTGSEGNGAAFQILAGYIGVTSAPRNNGSVPIAMTAPVVSTPIEYASKIEPHGVVLQTGYGNGDMSMAFLLPSIYSSVDACPVPKDSRVQLVPIPSRLIAVHTFSGSISEAVVKSRLELVLKALTRDGIPEENPSWNLAQYNPPFTIPSLRKNEIWVDVHRTEADLAK